MFSKFDWKTANNTDSENDFGSAMHVLIRLRPAEGFCNPSS